MKIVRVYVYVYVCLCVRVCVCVCVCTVVFDTDEKGRSCMFETTCRLQHGCKPNVEWAFDHSTDKVCALQCVAVCCSVLQHFVACCSGLQCVAACCSVLQRVAAFCSM